MLKANQPGQSANPVLVSNDKKISYKRNATHVAIAYYIYYQQRFNLAQQARGSPTPHTITLTLDPTQDARMLKTQTDLVNSKQPVPLEAICGMARGEVKPETDSMEKCVIYNV